MEQFTVKERREMSSKRRSVDRILATVEKAVLLCLALLIKMMKNTRKRKIATIELNPNIAKPATTKTNNAIKLNTNKPTTSKTGKAKTTANKTASSVLPTDLAKLEAAELEGM